MRRITGVLVVVLLVLSSVPAFGATKFRRSLDRVPGQYTVIFNADLHRGEIPILAKALVDRYGGELATTWTGALKGFAVYAAESAAVAMSANPNVAFVEENARMFPAVTQYSPPWHLDRLDDPSGLDGSYSYCNDGFGVAYVIDTGVWANHSDFITNGYSRVAPGADFSTWDGASTATNPCSGTDNYGAGHGTSVASVLAGNTFGVAKGVTVIPVRVLDCNLQGTVWQTINGITWVYEDWSYYRGGPAVVNMSVFRRVNALTANELSALEHAVQQLIVTGLQVVASANNGNGDACLTSPARMPDVVTVAGTNDVDARWICEAPATCGQPCNNPGSNFGTCVKIFAPAHNIRSAHILHATSEREANFPGTTCDARSGTSFSAPIVSGAILRYQEDVGGYRSPTQIRAWLYADGSGSHDNIVTNQGDGSPRRLVFKASGGYCP